MTYQYTRLYMPLIHVMLGNGDHLPSLV